jgi:hypothetical protein
LKKYRKMHNSASLKIWFGYGICTGFIWNLHDLIKLILL